MEPIKSPVDVSIKKTSINKSSSSLDAAKQFESLILQEIMKAGKPSSQEAGLFSNEGTKMFSSLMDRQIADMAAKRGTGLGKYIAQAIDKK